MIQSSMIEPTFTCYTCRVGFTHPQLQRDHYKTEWHRYNLKRKVASLPPITSNDFHERSLAQKAQSEKEKQVVTLKCAACRKTFSCQNAHDNHLQSRKHRDAQAKYTDESLGDGSREKGFKDANTNEKADVKMNKCDKRNSVSDRTSDNHDSDSDGSWGSYDGEALAIDECLFCDVASDSLEANIRHMTIQHSFFIPDAEYLTDIEGFISYLGSKVGEGHMCLWCSEKGKQFHSARAVQKHMVDKGHCKVLHEGQALLEYSDFYDYTSSYPEGSGGDGDDQDDDSEDIEVIHDDGYELVLPSGATIGHRSLMRYYRQNIPERRVALNRKVLPNVLSQYKSLGWTGTTGAMAVKKAADIKFMQRARTKYDLNVRMKGNKLQRYFRDPNGLIR